MAAWVDHSWARARKRDKSSSDDAGESGEEVPSAWRRAAESSAGFESVFSDDMLSEHDAEVGEETEVGD